MRLLLMACGLLLVAACNAQPAETPTQPEPPRFEVVSADPVEHGERLSAVLGCTGCHTPGLTGEDWSEPELGVLWTANLTRSAAAYSHDELAAMITEGRRPDRALIDMPSALFTEMHPADIDALVTYLKSLNPKGAVQPAPTIGPQLAKQIATGEFKDSVQQVAEMRGQFPPDMGSAHDYGRFIVRATCVECHGMDLRGGKQMAGAMPVDLRVMKLYSAEEFSTLLQTGKALGDRELELMSAVARRRYARFTEAEREAVFGYLTEVARREP
ncbi:c-type cytochrome [Erythrobacter sp. JK5]|uniref:c-type cytochrome n=1 Tax=Erythrobacter sp. JK5 TaxID=2829500 RepID=UPI001BAB0024|nr:c-type cytochrome [Erythrobacter sp. JK5]QUL38538.1 c-type cytochrome [Erythrobacter sp. JK5]